MTAQNYRAKNPFHNISGSHKQLLASIAENVICTPEYGFSRCQYVTFSGSISYGLNKPDSDIDLLGVFLCWPEMYIGVNFDQPLIFHHTDGNIDITMVEYRKFIFSAMSGNIRYNSALWVNPNHIITQKFPLDILRAERNMFVSMKMVWPIIGYAKNEANLAIQKKESYGKHACNAMRLLGMAKDLLTDGVLNVYRDKDQDYLISLRDENISLNDFVSSFNNAEEIVQKLTESNPLKKEPDYKRINDICMAGIFSTFIPQLTVKFSAS